MNSFIGNVRGIFYRSFTPQAKLLMTVVCAIFVIEITIMVVGNRLPNMTNLQAALLDAMILSLLLLPLLHRAVYQPSAAKLMLSKAHSSVKTLLEINQMEDKSIDEIMEYTLENGLLHTESEYGFVGLLNETETIFKTYAYSQNTKDHCAISDQNNVHTVDSGGLWAESIRTRKPFICNDYPNSDMKTATLPSGHIPMRRFASIPAFSGNKIVSLILVANKKSDYTMYEAELLASLMSGVVRYIERRKSRELLRTSREHLRTLMDSTSDMFLLIDRNGTILTINRMASLIHGHSPEYYFGKSYFETISAKYYEDRRSKIKEVIRSGNSITFEDKIGNVCLDNTIFPVFGQDGSVEKLTIVSTNISDKRNSEIELRQKDEMMNAIISSAKDAIIVLDAEGKISLWNRAAEIIFGYSSEDVSGKSMADFIIPERYREQHNKAYRMFSSRGYGRLIGTTLELSALRKSGDEFPIELSLGSFCINDTWNVVGVVRDVTKRKLRDIELAHSEEKFKTLAEESPLMIIIFTVVSGKIAIKYVNNRFVELLGYGKDEACSPYFDALKLLDPEQIPIAKENVISLMNGNELRPGVFRLRARDGKPLDAILATKHIRYLGSNAILGTLNDITDKIRSEQLLMRQEKLAAIGILSAGVAHEILNPLNIIGTIVQIMQMKPWPEETKNDLKDIMDQIARATKITNNLRMFSHVHKREIKSVDLHALFDKTASLIEHDFILDNIKIIRDYDVNFPPVRVDEDYMAQVFLNLLTNAKHAMMGNGVKKERTITVKTTAIPDGAEIRISDNGPGIPKDIIGKIFGPFFTTKNPNEGTGLGLSMVLSFIQSFGGNITVESEEGKVATFIISLATNTIS